MARTLHNICNIITSSANYRQVPTIGNSGIDYRHRALVQAVGMAHIIITLCGRSRHVHLCTSTTDDHCHISVPHASESAIFHKVSKN